MIEFEIQASLGNLDRVLSETVSPITYWEYTHFGGVDWMVSNAHQAVKTVRILDDQLATFVRLRMQ
jgi:hypothetical protein